MGTTLISMEAVREYEYYCTVLYSSTWYLGLVFGYEYSSTNGQMDTLSCQHASVLGLNTTVSLQYSTCLQLTVYSSKHVLECVEY